MIPHLDCKQIHQKHFHLQYTKEALGLCNKELVILSFLSLLMLRESRRRLKQCQSLQDSPAHWGFNTV